MDQRRFISFLLISFAIVMAINLLMPQPPAQQKPAGKGGAQAEKAKQPGEAEQPADGGAAAAKEGENRDAPQQPPAQPQAVAEIEAPRELVTLGSLDPRSGYRMLVTLTSTGAGVKRAELSNLRYADQHDRSGYTGLSELTRVTTV